MILAKNYDSTSSDCNNFVGCHQWIFLCYCSGAAAVRMKNVNHIEIDIYDSKNQRRLTCFSNGKVFFNSLNWIWWIVYCCRAKVYFCSFGPCLMLHLHFWILFFIIFFFLFWFTKLFYNVMNSQLIY